MALTVSSFDIEGGKKYFGLISACGSFGASCAGFLVSNYLYDKQILSLIITVASLILAVYFSSLIQRDENDLSSRKDSSMEEVFEQFIQIKNNPLIRSFILYAFIWTCLSTAMWFFQLEIVNAYADTSAEKTKVFGQADQFVLCLRFYSNFPYISDFEVQVSRHKVCINYLRRTFYRCISSNFRPFLWIFIKQFRSGNLSDPARCHETI